MKKLFVVMLIALFILAFAACSGETASTTQGTATTPKTPAVTTPTAPVVTSTTPTTTLPATTPGTTTPATTAYIPPVQKEIKEKIKTAWYNEVHRMNGIAYSMEADGSKTYTWSLTLKAESGLFLNLPEDHDTYPNLPGIQLTTGEGAVVYIRDTKKDEDFTKYPVKEGSWKTARWCDIWFEAEGFVPSIYGDYEIYLFFTLPNVEGATPYPGEEIYVWAFAPKRLCGDWIIIDPIVDDIILNAYKCSLDSYNEKYDISHTETKPENFPTNTFNFTVKSEDGHFPHLEGGLESFREITPEGAFAYVKGPNDTEFTRYECDYMLTERNCDMWFTLKDFTPVAGTRYEMVFFFMSGESATYPNSLHYVHSNEWLAGAPVAQ